MQVGNKERVVRTRSGCLTCRHRKKKCDETRSADTGGCMRCKNAGYECLGYPKRKSVSAADMLSIDGSVAAASSSSSSPPPATAPPLVAQVLDTPLLHAPVLGASPSSSSCSIIGRCILLGQPICEGCLSTIQPVLSPSDSVPAFSLPGPFPSSIDSTSRHKPVLQSLIGYYAVVITCWVEGCHPRAIAQSTFFKELVQYLFARIDHDEGLRLSIACCASGYIGGGQLSWPEDLVAIQDWTETLRRGATELVDVAVTSSQPAVRPLEETGDRLARHSYIDRHLSRHARYLYRMANKVVQQTLERCAQAPNSMMAASGPASSAACISVGTMQQCNNLLLSLMSQAIFSWAELSIQSYYQDFDTALQAVNAITGGVRRVKLSALYSIETLGFATVVWGDVTSALARGTRPYFYLDDEEEGGMRDEFPFNFFNCPTPLLKCLSDLARLRFDCSVLPVVPGQRVVLRERHAQQASEIESKLNSIAAITHPSTQFTGSPNCSEMTRLGAVILLYSTIYRKGPLHPTIKYSLQCCLNLWQYGAKSFCQDVGCSNYIFAIFLASSVACEARDRVICDEAMGVVGHNEATADAGRRLIKEVWRRTDDGGMPVSWSDIVNEGAFLVAFL